MVWRNYRDHRRKQYRRRCIVDMPNVHQTVQDVAGIATRISGIVFNLPFELAMIIRTRQRTPGDVFDLVQIAYVSQHGTDHDTRQAQRHRDGA